MAVALYLVGGMIALTFGAEVLVRGASRLAAMVRISPLTIGLTVVAFGTSAPELAVSVQSAFTGQADLAVGNVVGSNVLNVLLILGVSALIIPLVVSQQLVRFDVPLMIVLSAAVYLLGFDGLLGRLDGLLLTAGLITYVVWSIQQSRKERPEIVHEYEEGLPIHNVSPTLGAVLMQLVSVVGGLALLILGSRWFVGGAVILARGLGISELIIGLTIVAVGTSLPEVATSILAAIRGERDIAVGNVVGSNIFNILAVLGLSGIVAPTGVAISPAAMSFDIPVMIAVAVACLPIFFTGYRISRWEGALFLGYYIAYTMYLILGATEHDSLPLFSHVMALYVIPLTVITLIVVSYRAWQIPNTGAGS